MPAGFRRHLVGKTLTHLEMFATLLSFKYGFFDHVDVFLELNG